MGNHKFFFYLQIALSQGSSLETAMPKACSRVICVCAAALPASSTVATAKKKKEVLVLIVVRV